MHPSIHARSHPDKPAFIMARTGETVTYQQLDERSNQGANLFRQLGLISGASVAFFVENHPRYFELLWAAQRSGLRYTCISSKLAHAELEYILADCEAQMLITSSDLVDIASRAVEHLACSHLYVLGKSTDKFSDYEAARNQQPITPISDQCAGSAMLYSSGTTGKPKGIKRTTERQLPIDTPHPIAEFCKAHFGWNDDTIYLNPAPLYHAAPLGWSMAIHAIGGTVILMEQFDAEETLALIDRYQITAGQWVPTHFVRMLKLPDIVRKRYKLGSLRSVIHAAAPCPVKTKEEMIEWWGPIIHEYYAGTEGNGFCLIDSHEWLEHKGSVGKCLSAEVKICDENGDELPPRAEGIVYFAGGPTFEYHGDPAKTAESTNKHGWTTLGDIGWVDEEQYLYLTDRKSFMIISGGVNIYPQEIENLLIEHPKVADAAVVGGPSDEMGELVVAVVQTNQLSDATPEFATELSVWIRERISHVKAPRQIDFMEELPRQPTGKLYKRLIRDTYWGKSENPVILIPGMRP